jgi:transcriptional regulator with XRE-family HTH domain
MPNKQIGKRIQLIRKQRGLTQEQLAELVDLSTNHISAVERGIHQPTTENLVKIMTVLDCSADELFQDVIPAGTRVQASLLSEKLKALPMQEQKRILQVVDLLIQTSPKN